MDSEWLRGPVRQVRDVTSLDEAKACAEEIIRSAWAHGFTPDLHVDAMNRLLDQVAGVLGHADARVFAMEVAVMSTDAERAIDAGYPTDQEVRAGDSDVLDNLISKARKITGGKP